MGSLNIAEFPDITFVSTRIQQTGERTAFVYGNLTIVGISKEVALIASSSKIDP